MTQLADPPVSVRLKLAALWTATMFLFVYVDIVGFYKPGTIDDILVGRVWEFDISQTWALGVLVLMTIPAAMIALSLMLPPRAARRVNIAVGALHVPLAIGNAIGETWAFYWFGAAVETLLLALIIRQALAWPLATSSRRSAG